MYLKILIASLFFSVVSLAADVCIVTQAAIGTSIECSGKSQVVNSPVSSVLASLLNSGYVFVGQSPTASGTTYTLVRK